MNNFSHQYFGKNLTELTYSDIAKYFIDEHEESDKIEFKSFHPDHGAVEQSLEGVIRAICAFLNSNGGLLIWGAPVGKKVGDRKIFIGPLAPVDRLIDKDKLISKISDSITPLPVNINVQTIETDGLYLYIFEIQQSVYSPHQYKSTYWARLDGQTKPAPHYLVDALFKKVTYPNIGGYVNLERIGPLNREENFLDISIIILNFSELQNEYDVSYRLTCPQAVFVDSREIATRENYSMGGHQFVNQGNIKILHFGQIERKVQRLAINVDDLYRKYSYTLNLHLSFGGRLSPLKSSSYVLSYQVGSVTTDNPVELFQSWQENELAADKTRELGTTHESILAEILKRPRI